MFNLSLQHAFNFRVRNRNMASGCEENRPLFLLGFWMTQQILLRHLRLQVVWVKLDHTSELLLMPCTCHVWTSTNQEVILVNSSMPCFRDWNMEIKLEPGERLSKSLARSMFLALSVVSLQQWFCTISFRICMIGREHCTINETRLQCQIDKQKIEETTCKRGNSQFQP